MGSSKNGSNTENESRKPIPEIDTLIITGPSVVIIKFDSTGWEKTRLRMGHNEYETARHECVSLMTNTRSSLKEYWPQLRLVEVSGPSRVLFITGDGKRTVIEVDDVTYPCGAFLFNGRKPPVFSDMMNLGTDMDYYFKK